VGCSVSERFSCHLVRGQFAQLRVNTGQHILRSLPVPLPGSFGGARFRDHEQRWNGIPAGESGNAERYQVSGVEGLTLFRQPVSMKAIT